ncbi:MFS transporter [Alicyclobacillus tolerans]|uniref:MFS transporter n=1 Tax=Alicyclobacillus tolerans TaxID=90970 RepID=UPI001F1DAA9E|nr:MFS transporter [Alicyclobacillus tolerans]MCF8563239.1 MFS transporter [Alicyclobacillus tolerans]
MSVVQQRAHSVETRSHMGGLFGLSWSHFLNDGSANYLPGILPAVLISLHEPVRMAGVLMAALLIGQALQPLMGFIADRLGGRALIMLGLLGSTAGGALLGTTHYLWVFIGLLLLIGLGNAMFHPQALAAVRSRATQRQGLMLSLFLIGGELGRGVWPTATSFVVVHYGLPSLWMFVFPALITIPFIPKWAPRLPAKRATGNRIHWASHLRPLAMLVGFGSIRSLITYGLVTFIPIMWHLEGGSLVAGASIITTLLAVGVIGNLGGGHLVDRMGRRPVLLLSAILTSVLIPGVIYARGPWLWVIAGLLGISVFLSASTTILIGQDIFPENRSMGSGIALGLTNGIGAMLVLLIGFWVNNTNILTVFWIFAAAGLLSISFLFGFSKELIGHMRA